MSALGHKGTFAVQNAMSALRPIADMCDANRDVRFVPIADIAIIRSLHRHERVVSAKLQDREHERSSN
jgi:hypothetical protein